MSRTPIIEVDSADEAHRGLSYPAPSVVGISVPALSQFDERVVLRKGIVTRDAERHVVGMLLI